MLWLHSANHHFCLSSRNCPFLGLSICLGDIVGLVLGIEERNICNIHSIQFESRLRVSLWCKPLTFVTNFLCFEHCIV